MKIEINGIEINYIVEGEGQDVIVLHGWGASIDTVIPIVNGLKDNFRVHAIDLPGFGKSRDPKEVIGSFEYGEMIKKYIEINKLNKVVLIGHSFGGKISIIMGAKYPDLVKKIILVNSAGLKPKRKLKYHIKVYSFKLLKFIYKGFFFWKDNDKVMEKFYKRFGSTDYKDASGIMRSILVRVVNEDLQDILKDIKCPTLLIWGSKDMDTPLYMGVKMEKEIKDSGLVVFEDAGHYSYLDQINRFNIIVNNFLSK